MITRRDFIVAGVSILITAAVIALAQPVAKPVMHSAIFNWKDIKVEQTCLLYTSRCV